MDFFVKLFIYIFFFSDDGSPWWDTGAERGGRRGPPTGGSSGPLGGRVLPAPRRPLALLAEKGTSDKAHRAPLALWRPSWVRAAIWPSEGHCEWKGPLAPLQAIVSESGHLVRAMDHSVKAMTSHRKVAFSRLLNRHRNGDHDHGAENDIEPFWLW